MVDPDPAAVYSIFTRAWGSPLSPFALAKCKSYICGAREPSRVLVFALRWLVPIKSDTFSAACEWDQGYLQYEEVLDMLPAKSDYAALLDKALH